MPRLTHTCALADTGEVFSEEELQHIVHYALVTEDQAVLVDAVAGLSAVRMQNEALARRGDARKPGPVRDAGRDWGPPRKRRGAHNGVDTFAAADDRPGSRRRGSTWAATRDSQSPYNVTADFVAADRLDSLAAAAAAALQGPPLLTRDAAAAGDAAKLPRSTPPPVTFGPPVTSELAAPLASPPKLAAGPVALVARNAFGMPGPAIPSSGAGSQQPQSPRKAAAEKDGAPGGRGRSAPACAPGEAADSRSAPMRRPMKQPWQKAGSAAARAEQLRPARSASATPAQDAADAEDPWDVSDADGAPSARPRISGSGNSRRLRGDRPSRAAAEPSYAQLDAELHAADLAEAEMHAADPAEAQAELHSFRSNRGRGGRAEQPRALPPPPLLAARQTRRPAGGAAARERRGARARVAAGVDGAGRARERGVGGARGCGACGDVPRCGAASACPRRARRQRQRQRHHSQRERSL